MGPRINGVINGVINGMINGMINGVRVKFRSIKLEFKAQSKRIFTLTPFIPHISSPHFSNQLIELEN